MLKLKLERYQPWLLLHAWCIYKVLRIIYSQETKERAICVKLEDETIAIIGKYSSESGDTAVASLSKEFSPQGERVKS